MIRIESLSKRYKNCDTSALDDISFTIKSASVFGLLGQNGAGKTTFMNILATIIQQSQGKIFIDEMEVTPANYHLLREMIGYMPQDFDMYSNLTIVEILFYFGLLRDIKKNILNERIEYLLNELNLKVHSRKKYKALSGGMKRRVGLAIAMLHDPRVLIIDEPTAGVDPEERAHIRDLIIQIGKKKTVLFSTHIIEDVEQTCDELAIFQNGQLRYIGNQAELMKKYNGRIREADAEELSSSTIKYDVLRSYKTGSGQKVKFLVSNKNLTLGKHLEVSLEDSFLALYKEENDEKLLSTSQV